MAYSDQELLAILSHERRNSIGFDEDPELTAQREQALNYYKGEMPDVPAMAKRSKAQSSDVADAVETGLPDLIEIFTGGDDVLAFSPQGPEDEKAAEQETDFVKHVFFNENAGFLTLYSMLKDAFLSKIGVVKWWWDPYAGESCEEFTGQSLDAVAMAAQGGAEIQDLRRDDPDAEGMEDGDFGPLADLPETATFSFTAYRPGGRLCIEPVPPEDFTAARDARINLGQATYCAIRIRPRVQQLIAWGLDAATVRNLPAYGTRDDGTVSLARDTVSEQTQAQGAGDSLKDLRQVEVIEHFIRLADDQGKLEIWRVLTAASETTLLLKEKVNRIQYAVITPYIQTHRLYGQSVADKLIQVQQIKTALMRMFLDSGYFALNQRMQVVEGKANEHTLSDLMRNEPLVPVRVKEDGAVTPLTAGGLTFDVTGALEYFSTVGEQRTGIVRNAQGLNPDTLHDTAKGAMALMSAAQKRLRLIARVCAETGLKDLFLGIHATLRENATQAQTVRLRNDWVSIDPTSWGERADMTVEIGLGAAGREHDLAALQAIMPVIEQVVTSQGGMNGPLVTVQNVYAMVLRMMEKLGFKGAERYISDPSKAPPAPPPPDPAQHAQELAMAKVQADAETQRQKNAADLQLQQQKMVNDLQLAREKAQSEFVLRQQQQAAELALKKQEMAAEAALKQQEIAMRATNVNPGLGPVNVGGEAG